MQQTVTGAARLNRRCYDKEGATGLYVIRLLIASDGGVFQATPIAAPSRASTPSAYSGVAPYIDSGRKPENEITRCLANALRKVRFRKFGGPTVGFDYPVVIEKRPPSEAKSPLRACEEDSDCVYRPQKSCACPSCGKIWRRAINRLTAKKWQKKKARSRARDRRRCRRLRRRRKCPPCEEKLVWRGSKLLCIDQQCSVR